MTRLVRIDDFPHGDKAIFDKNTYRRQVAKVLEIFEHWNINYILGVSPELLDLDKDVDFLNDIVCSGRVVMHGFNHGWDREWSTITDTWPRGGEFEGMNIDQIVEKYNANDQLMQNIHAYDDTHFIPPFNCVTQELIDSLWSATLVETLYSCDKEYNSYSYKNLVMGDIKWDIAKYHVNYDYAYKVIDRLDDPSTITLHWIYDIQRINWKGEYEELCRRLVAT